MERFSLVTANGTKWIQVTLDVEEVEEEIEQTGIPGFPFISVISGLILGILSLKW